METCYPLPALKRAMKIQEVILRAMSGQIHWYQAAEIIGISCRQMRRWRARYERYGYDGLYDRRKKRPSPKRVPLKLAEEILRLYRERYFDFNVSHFCEKLKGEHGINMSYNWVRIALQEAGLVKKRGGRDKHRKKRPRKPLVGMMIHLDGSNYDWLSVGSSTDLVVLSDDATNRIYDMALVDEEDSLTCMSMLKDCVEKRGIFCSLYTDRASHFFNTKQAGGKVDKDNLTQIGRALKELGISHIPSYSPQARGRAERLFKTLQGRLPQEFRLRDIRRLEEANEYLRKTYIREHNRRFAQAPPQKGSAFMEVPKELDLNKVFCFKHERTVNCDNTVSFKKRLFQIAESKFRVSFARCKVTVYEHLDGSVSIGYGPHILGYYSPEGLPKNSHSRRIEITVKGREATANHNQERTDHVLEKADILIC